MKGHLHNVFDSIVAENDKIAFDYLKWLTVSCRDIHSDSKSYLSARKDGGSPMWIYSPSFDATSNELYSVILDNIDKENGLGIISNESCYGYLKKLSDDKRLVLEKYMRMNVYSGKASSSVCCGTARLIRPTEGTEKEVRALTEAMISESRMTDLKYSDIPEFVSYALTSGNVFFLFDEKIRAMANIAYRNGKLARINTVVTSPDSRGLGCGGKLITALSEMLSDEGYTPVIFADADYPASNRLYGGLGLKKVGELAEYRLSKQVTN